jgi:16S rRNA processing protein RimM
MGGDGGRLVLLGVITGARGVRGEVRIKPFTEAPEDIAAYGPLFDETGARRFDLVSVTPAKGGVTARIGGIDDRDAAEALKGTGLHVPREALPEAGEEAWYHDDLVGLAVKTRDGETLGRIRAVVDFGAGDLLEIEFAGRKGSDLVPFTRDYVPEVDPASGHVTVRLPANFFKDEPEAEAESGPDDD